MDVQRLSGFSSPMADEHSKFIPAHDLLVLCTTSLVRTNVTYSPQRTKLEMTEVVRYKREAGEHRGMGVVPTCDESALTQPGVLTGWMYESGTNDDFVCSKL